MAEMINKELSRNEKGCVWGMIILGCMSILCDLGNPIGEDNCSAYLLLKNILHHKSKTMYCNSLDPLLKFMEKLF